MATRESKKQACQLQARSGEADHVSYESWQINHLANTTAPQSDKEQLPLASSAPQASYQWLYQLQISINTYCGPQQALSGLIL